jgi:prevent-host-death family protein
LDKATDDFEPITITRKGNHNAVLISADTYNNMVENQFVLGNPTNLKWLEESKDQAQKGLLTSHDLIDPENSDFDHE